MNLNNHKEGFTLVELLVVISVVAILFAVFGTFFTNSLYQYFDLQTDTSSSVELTQTMEHMAAVLRSVTDINSAQSNNLSVYAYFSPADTYVSLVDYYVNVSGNEVLASVTPMTSNPPVGTPITSETSTYIIISNYYQPAGGSLFSYFDAGDNLLTPPIANEHDIVSVGLNLNEPASHNSKGQPLYLSVSLRNREINI